MKTIFIIGIFLTLGGGLIHAQQAVPNHIIKQVAQNYMTIQNPQRQWNIRSVEKTGLSITSASLQFRYNVSIINYEEGGWTITSNDYNAPPILAFSESESFVSDTNLMPENFKYWYNECIDYVKSYSELETFKKSESGSDNRSLWLSLQSPTYIGQKIAENQSKSASFVPDLLVDYNRGGGIMWGQSANNDYTCNNAYNAKMPGRTVFIGGCFGNNKTDCTCDKKPVGCGGVAMGQLMWYWKFPPQYDWDDIPAALYESSSPYIANEVADVLRNCGDAAGTTYCCSGSYTLHSSILNAMKSDFQYPNARILKKRQMSSNEWKRIIKYEIDAGRPVIYRGDKCDFCASNKHIWLVSGYNSDMFFNINWGWRGNLDGYFNLDILVPNPEKEPDDHFRKNNQIIFNLYPNNAVSNQGHITRISKNDGEILRAFGYLITADQMQLNKGSKTRLIATHSITINAPYEIASQADFKAEIVDQSLSKNDGRFDDSPYQGDTLDDETSQELMSSFSSGSLTDSIMDFKSSEFNISPNPSNGTFQIQIHHSAPETQYPYEFLIFDLQGRLLYQTMLNTERMTVDCKLPHGIYIGQIQTNNTILDISKIIIQ